MDGYVQAQRSVAERIQWFTGTAFDPSVMGTLFPWMAPSRPAAPPAEPAPPPPAGDPVSAELAELRRRLADLEGKVRK
jgi:hypothetical protein